MSSLVVSISTDCCFKVPAGEAPERVRFEVKPYCEECRATRVEPSWGTHLDLDFPIAKKRRPSEAFDALQEKDRRASIAERRQHQTQRRSRVLVHVDLEDF
jgi:hypothetical protein